MANLKIRFTRDYQQLDEKVLDFVEGQVVSMNEASAMHYVNRQVAVIAGRNEKAGKPSKQVAADLKGGSKKDPEKKTVGEKISHSVKAGIDAITGKGKDTGKRDGPVEGKAIGEGGGSTEGKSTGEGEGPTEGKATGEGEGSMEGKAIGEGEGSTEGKATGEGEGKK